MRSARPAPTFLRAALLMVGLACAGKAHADEAADAFRRGKSAFAEHRYEAAATAFKAAYDHKPHPSAKFNEAQSWEAAGRSLEAARCYRDALAREGLPEAASREARDSLTRLAKRLARIRVTVPNEAEIEVDTERARGTSLDAFAAPGTVTVTVRRGGVALLVRSVRAETGTSTIIDVLASEMQPPTAPVQTSPPTVETAAKPAPPPPSPSPSPPPPKRSRVPAIVAWSGAAVAGGLGAGFLVHGLNARDRFVAEGRVSDDLRGDALRDRAVATTAFSVAIVAIAVGVWLYPRAPKGAVGAFAWEGARF